MRAIVFGLLIAIAGCAPAANEPTAVETPTPAPVATPEPAPAAVAGLPPAKSAAPGVVDHSCKTAADCAIKDVGSCCGKLPQCVNKDSPTFPDQVKAQCASEGRSSICGFQDIASCDCIDGRCTGVAGGGASGELQKD